MLVFIDSRLDIAPALLNAWTGRELGIFVFTGTADASSWLEVKSGQRRSLEETLEAHIEKRPGMNQVLLFWKDAESLATFVTALSRLLRTYRVECSGVVSESSPSTDFTPLFEATKSSGGETVRFIDNLAFIGQENAAGDEVSAMHRKRHMTALLQLLLEGGDTVTSELGFFRKDEHPLLAFGIYSGLRSHERVEATVRSIANRLLIEGFEKESKRDADLGGDFKQRARFSLERAKALALPESLSSGTVEGEWAEALEEARSHADWKCPWLKARALESGRSRIRRQFADFRKARRQFLALVVAGAAKLRESGQSVFEKEQREKADWVMEKPSLGRLSALLLKHFPEYDDLKREQRQETKTACLPLSHPDENVCHQQIHGTLTETLEASADRLPGLKAWIIVAGVSLSMLLGAWLLFRQGTDGLGVWLGRGALLLPIVFAIRNWYLARKTSQLMRQEYQQGCDWLEREMHAKLDWILEKTRRTLQTQIIAANNGVARRLNYGLKFLLQEWDELKQRLDTDGKANDSKAADMDMSGLANFESRLAELLEDLSRHLAKRALESEALQAPLSREFESIIFQSYRHATAHPNESVEAHATVEALAAERLSPPIAAKVNKAILAQGIQKRFFIPTSWRNDTEASIEQRTNPYPTDSFSTLRCDISGPFVWTSKPNLTIDEARKALEQQRIGS